MSNGWHFLTINLLLKIELFAQNFLHKAPVLLQFTPGFYIFQILIFFKMKVQMIYKFLGSVSSNLTSIFQSKAYVPRYGQLYQDLKNI